MRLQDIMNRNVKVIDPGATLKQAAQKMAEYGLGGLPVWDEGHILGMITDRDITIRVAAEGRDPTHTEVREVMSAPAVCGAEDQSIADALQLMCEKGFRRLPVLNRRGRLVGICSLADAAAHVEGAALKDALLRCLAVPVEGRPRHV